MVGTVVMIVVLVVVFPVLVLTAGAVGSAVIGALLQRERDAAYEGTEQLATSRAYAPPGEDEELTALLTG